MRSVDIVRTQCALGRLMKWQEPPGPAKKKDRPSAANVQITKERSTRRKARLLTETSLGTNRKQFVFISLDSLSGSQEGPRTRDVV